MNSPTLDNMALASICNQRYIVPVAANSAAGFGDPTSKRRYSAPTDAGAFFVPSIRFYGGCARETERSAGFLLPRFANLCTAVTPYRLATIGDGSPAKGEPPMRYTLTLNPSKDRARAHRAMALAALRSNTSLKHRLNRYNAHMQRARALEAQEVANV